MQFLVIQFLPSPPYCIHDQEQMYRQVRYTQQLNSTHVLHCERQISTPTEKKRHNYISVCLILMFQLGNRNADCSELELYCLLLFQPSYYRLIKLLCFFIKHSFLYRKLTSLESTRNIYYKSFLVSFVLAVEYTARNLTNNGDKAYSCYTPI